MLQAVLGLFVFVGLAWVMSSQRRKFPWKLVIAGLLLQLALGWLILATGPGRGIFEFAGNLVAHLLEYVDAGSDFMFQVNPRKGDPTPKPQPYVLLRTFAFNVLPTVIFFSSLMSILYFLRIMPWVVRGMGWVMQKTLGTSGAESLAAAANVFVGHTEAPLVVRPYLPDMTTSELNAVMIGGFATISSGLLAAYVGLGISATHLIAASVISAPAALLIAKIMEPETGTPKTMGGVEVEFPQRSTNVVEAAAAGATEGLQLVLNIGAILIAFIALIAMCNGLLGWTGKQFGYVGPQGQSLWTLEATLGNLFAPIAWLMGIEWRECRECGELLGVKIVANEFIAYAQMGEWLKQPSRLSPRAAMIMTYALAGFSNLGAIGIQIGGIGALAPSRRSDLARLGLRAMLGGALACCMTASVAAIISPATRAAPAHRNTKQAYQDGSFTKQTTRPCRQDAGSRRPFPGSSIPATPPRSNPHPVAGRLQRTRHLRQATVCTIQLPQSSGATQLSPVLPSPYCSPRSILRLTT